jgi:hypothetical protein
MNEEFLYGIVLPNPFDAAAAGCSFSCRQILPLTAGGKYGGSTQAPGVNRVGALGRVGFRNPQPGFILLERLRRRLIDLNQFAIPGNFHRSFLDIRG